MLKLTELIRMSGIELCDFKIIVQLVLPQLRWRHF